MVWSQTMQMTPSALVMPQPQSSSAHSRSTISKREFTSVATKRDVEAGAPAASTLGCVSSPQPNTSTQNRRRRTVSSFYDAPHGVTAQNHSSWESSTRRAIVP
jgi:hypothetical protein